MKKILFIALFLLVSPFVQAKSIHQQINVKSNLKESNNIYWQLGGPGEAVNIENGSPANLKVFIYVNRAVNIIFPADPITVNCNDKMIPLRSNASVICQLNPGKAVSFIIRPEDFINGSSGVYYILS